MHITTGSRLGVYEITASIGEGGMGQVFRATDTRLKRQVAIKILPPAVAEDQDRLARFQREAEVLASLNHPNISHIFGLDRQEKRDGQGGTTYIIMELVEGDDLSQRIVRGAIPFDEALPIARQIAEALEAAHEKGIVHRDLKPANIKVRADGTVKVLDFGLAKAIEGPGRAGGAGGAGGLENSPTLTSPAMMTGIGMILGTAAYMAPEQARGKAVDKRADIWAFGCVLYEMLSGARTFPGEDVGDTLATVVKTEPDWSLLPADTPAPIRTLLRRCLRKDPRQRLADAGAARIEIEDALAAPAAGAVGMSAPNRRQAALITALAGVAIVAAAMAGARFGGSRAAQPRQNVVRLALPLPPGAELKDGASVVISPDGALVAYAAMRGGISELYTRPLDAIDARVVTGTSGAIAPFFSPDGQWLGFIAGGRLKKVSTSGGVVVTLTDAGAVGGWATWGSDDTIVFSSPRGLAAIPAAGGEVRLLQVRKQEGQVIQFRNAEFLPGGEALLVASTPGDAATTREGSIEALTLKTGQRKTLIQGTPYAHYLPTGHLIFLVDGTLKAVPFDLQKLELTGSPVEVVTGVRQQQFTGTGAFSCSRTGTCVLIAGGTAASRTVAMVDRTGAAQSLSLPPKSYANPRFSPAGDKIALWVEQLSCNLEVIDLARGTVTRLTSDGDNHFPIWNPDGQRLTYVSSQARTGSYGIVSRPANGSGSEELLAQTLNKLSPITPLAWSPGGVLAFADRGDIWLWSRGVEPQAFAPSQFDENAPAFSPDGRWLAYVSDEAGRYDVYVRPFPGPGEKYLVSTAGGLEPVWSRNGRELFFRSGDQVLAVQVGTTTAFSASRPKVLFTGPFARARGADRIMYDASPDGEHFVMLNSGEEDRAVTQISVLLNWFEELKARVPGK